jgi:zinc/manganese transport system substrate-binding protein
VSRRALVIGVVGVSGLLSLAACSSPSGAPAGTISVVSSTNVYGDIVDEIAGPLAGDKVRVASIISDPAADPHSYEASTRTQLAMSRADLIVENGGGYDDFVDTLRKAANADATVLDVVDISGKSASGGELNEHVWYDFPTIRKFANRVAEFLARRDKADATTYRANAQRFVARLRALEAMEMQIKKAHGGTGVAITEPVPLYMLEACGLVNRTPEAFSRSIEEDTDVAPRVLEDTLALFAGHQVQLLAYNDQTTSGQTDKVLDAAHKYHVPTVAVGETLPDGKNYLTWMRGLLAQIAHALH